MGHHVSLGVRHLWHMLVTQGARGMDPSEVTMLLGQPIHIRRRDLSSASPSKSQKWMLKGPRSMHTRVVWEALTYLRRPPMVRSHPAAIPLILPMGIFEVLKVPTWLEAFGNSNRSPFICALLTQNHFMIWKEFGHKLPLQEMEREAQPP